MIEMAYLSGEQYERQKLWDMEFYSIPSMLAGCEFSHQIWFHSSTVFYQTWPNRKGGVSCPKD